MRLPSAGPKLGPRLWESSLLFQASRPAAAHLDSLLGMNPLSKCETRPLVPVLLPVALDQTYDYIVPDGVELEPGAFVVIPFGPQSRIGVVWDATLPPAGSAAQRPVDPKKLKAVTGRLDVPPLPAASLLLTSRRR